METAPKTVYTVLKEIAFYADLSQAPLWEKSMYLKWCVNLGGLPVFQAMFIEMLSGVLLLVAILGGAVLMYNYLEKGDSNGKK
ncbi:hypothetical protein 206_0120 [Phage 206]|nr:hypothetical protein 203_0120 [Phage 203]ATW61684.1 hypothetical protein 206_0120 [Phage 206]